MSLQNQPMTHYEIKAFRAKTGMTQTALAEAAGVSIDTVKSWETARSVCPGPWRLVFAAINSGLKPWAAEFIVHIRPQVRDGKEGSYAVTDYGQEVASAYDVKFIDSYKVLSQRLDAMPNMIRSPGVEDRWIMKQT